MKLKVERLVEVWVDEYYDIPDDVKDPVDAILFEDSYDYFEYSSCQWESAENVGPVKVYDEHDELIFNRT